MKKKNSPRRKVICSQPTEPVEECLHPEGRKQTYATGATYNYLWGHMVKEITQVLPEKSVACWYDDHTLTLPVCAYNKFLKERKCCKRCSLFQDDEYTPILIKSIEELEKDDLPVDPGDEYGS